MYENDSDSIIEVKSSLMNEKYINHNMKNFIENKASYFLKNSRNLPNLELEKFILWKIDRNRVFISMDLNCPAQCKFCYVDSLIAKRNKLSSIKLAKILCETVKNDKRFTQGKQGTTIMLSPFTDPFHENNIEASLEIINFFSTLKNFIDIATRFPLLKIDSLSPFSENILINFSLSSLQDNIEINNQYLRFKNAKKLISKGYNVTLYLRPIIQDITIHDIDKIIDLAKDSGIKVITIGGLYVDEKILHKLSSINIDISKYTKIKKKFVLDDKEILEKIKANDLEVIYKKLQNSGFNVFYSSDQRIEYYKSKLI